jgi:hypothetical protein
VSADAPKRWAIPGALVAAALTLPMWLSPHLWGTDRFFNEIRLVALSRCGLADGLWARWLPDLAHGHGFPLFHYYPPGLYVLARPLAALGLDPRSALLLVLTAAFALSAWAVYATVAKRSTALWGVCAAVLWVTAPYLHVDLQVRHAWAELLGLCFLPVALGGFLDLAEGDRRLGPLVRAIGGFALTLFCHNIAGLFAAGGAAALCLGLALPGRDRAAATRAGLALVAGLGLSAVIWLPALLDASLVRLESMATGPFAPHNHVIYPAQLFGVAFGRGPSVPGPDDAMSLSLGLVQAVSLIAVLTLSLARPRPVGLRQWLLAGMALGLVLLTLPPAAPVIEATPLLRSIQFPFRLLGPAALALAWGIPLVAARVTPTAARAALPLGLAAAALLASVPLFTDPLDMTARDRAAFEPVRAAGVEGVARLADPYATTAGLLEYLPDTVARYPTEPSPLVQAPPWIRAEVVSRRCESVTLAGDASEPGVLRLGAFDFPGVEVRLNGEPIPHRTDADLGFVLAPIPAAGPWTMEVRHADLGSAPLGRAVSLATLTLLALAYVRRRRA